MPQAVTYVGHTTAAAVSTGYTVPAPAARAAGDMLLCASGSDLSASHIPPGWNRMADAGGSTSYQSGVWRIADGTSADNAVFPNGVAVYCPTAVMAAYRGIDPKQPLRCEMDALGARTLGSLTWPAPNGGVESMIYQAAATDAIHNVGTPWVGNPRAGAAPGSWAVYDNIDGSAVSRGGQVLSAAQNSAGASYGTFFSVFWVGAMPNRAPSAPTVTAPNGGEVWDKSHTITWNAGSDPDGDALTYDIELSVDNGATWGRLYTGISGTSKVHDFTSAASTDTALIRIRAVDTAGAASPWDSSDGVFAISHNTAPYAPTDLSPAAGTTIDSDATQRFSWTFSDPDAQDAQSAYDLRYRPVGDSIWTAASGGSTEYHDFAGGTFTPGDWEWQLRTTDNAGAVGPYSSTATFTAGTAPAGHEISSPINGATIGASTFTVEWTTPAQDAYQVRTVADAVGAPDTATVYEDTGIVESANRARTMTFAVNNRDEHVQLRVRVDGLWSTWASVAVTVSYTPPATPTLIVLATSELVDGVPMSVIDVAVNNPAPAVGEPTVRENELHVRVAAGGRADGQRSVGDDGLHIADMARNGSHVDRAAAHGVAYEYRARAIGENDVSSWSAWT